MAQTEQYKQVHSPAGIQTAAIPAEKACAGEFYLQCSWRLILRQHSLETKWGWSLHRLPKLITPAIPQRPVTCHVLPSQALRSRNCSSRGFSCAAWLILVWRTAQKSSRLHSASPLSENVRKPQFFHPLSEIKRTVKEGLGSGAP